MKQTLLVVMCLCVFMSTVFAVTGHIKKSCCLTYPSKIPPIERLKKYEIQEDDGRCSIKAVIFITVQNRRFCADPDNACVKQLMKNIKARSAQRQKKSKAKRT
ncbi:C-C motif chemokine 17-like [Callorhinchus milii]|uniref:Lymphotactin-like n=1 Tax=Callorhinchus milii TaxID=7868 RepID=A0A4W3IW97_CALMI|nr:C-C motif chemokine 17-like [Callorhinchus milii]|eukprot:gi/632934556/ref/XP_007885473.1/ PREDICTED: lymphotactin-like [Callorhinchus milii]